MLEALRMQCWWWYKSSREGSEAPVIPSSPQLFSLSCLVDFFLRAFAKPGGDAVCW